MESHIGQTCERVTAAGAAIVAHDTSEFSYSGTVRREGLGRIKRKEQGFLAHTSLAISADGKRTPLGVLAFAPWTRGDHTRRKKANGKKKTGSDYAKETDKESDRWWDAVAETSLRVDADLIHVMDREADAYPLLEQLVSKEHRFVVRLSQNRGVETLDGEYELLRDALSRLEGIFTLDVPISPRSKSTTPGVAKTFASRTARTAKLSFRAATLKVQKPKYLTKASRHLDLNIVHVREADVPDGATAVDWVLATTEPIDTVQHVMTIVEYYRTRWLIEELFKALKTGCAVEKRQHESLHALLNAVAICIPIAWQMLSMRNLARATPDAAATEVLTPVQVEILRVVSPLKLKKHPTIGHALYAVAALGGHLKSNGEPGWLVLGRGMEYLLTLEVGWRAREKM